jgi:hypothetical protein
MKKVLGVVRLVVKCVIDKEELKKFEQEMGVE